MPPLNGRGSRVSPDIQRNLDRWQRLQERQAARSIEADENSTNVVDVQEPIPAAVNPRLWHSHPRGWWQNRAGRWIEISEMPDDYLRNVIQFVDRQARGRSSAVLDDLRREAHNRELRRRQMEQYQRDIEAQQEQVERLIRARMQRAVEEQPPPSRPIFTRVPLANEAAWIDTWRTPITPTPEPEAPPLPDRARRIKD